MKVQLKPFRVTCTSAEAWDADDSSTGICTNCGDVAEGTCEPDAREYRCEVCGKFCLTGFSELVMIGKVTITE